MRVAVYDRANSAWSSGSEYTRAQVAALLAVRDELDLDVNIVANGAKAAGTVSIAGVDVPVHPAATIRWGGRLTAELDRVLRKSKLAPVSQLRQWRSWSDSMRFDVLLSFMPPDSWWEPSDVAVCTWVWDLQHYVLPEMFSEERVGVLDTLFRRDATHGDLVIVSSEASKRDYVDFIPELAHKVRIYRFPSRFAFDPMLTSAPPSGETLEKYGIERDFFLVVNQFWRHKNHEAVVEAAALLKQSTGVCPLIVMIGLPYDDRDPSGRYISNLFAKIAQYGLEGRVKILGFVSAAERDELFRSCKALIQPSRFEGWNTSVEDAKAIGRPAILSDLEVHREQIPDAVGLFGCDDHARLAALLSDCASLPAGPDLVAENRALERSRAELAGIGRNLAALCSEAIDIAAARGAKLPTS